MKGYPEVFPQIYFIGKNTEVKNGFAFSWLFKMKNELRKETVCSLVHIKLKKIKK